MESFLDALADYLVTDPHAVGTAAIAWILGDFGTSSPTELPFGYITPFLDQPNPRSGKPGTGGTSGYDMDAYTVPLFVVDDLHKYGDPQPVAGKGYSEQPGYRALLRYGQSVRAALRKNITLDGLVATTGVAEIRFVPLVIDETVYRAARVTVTATQRRAR